MKSPPFGSCNFPLNYNIGNPKKIFFSSSPSIRLKRRILKIVETKVGDHYEFCNKFLFLRFH